MSNIYNNIQNLYNMDKTTWQEVLAELYNLVADTNQRFDTFEAKFEIIIGSEVIKVINQMYKDGTLATIINEQVFSQLDAKIDLVKNELITTISQNATDLNKTINEIKEEVSKNEKNIANLTTSNLSLKRYGRKFLKSESGIYHNAQAMCYIGNDLIIQSYQLYHGNTLKLEKMNIKTGEVLSSNIIDGFHGNGMCYNVKDNYIYISPAHNYGSTTTFKTILKINIETLEINETIDLTSKTNFPYIHSIGYDEINGNYVVNHKNSFEVYSKEWELIKSFTIELMYNENRYQTITVANGYIYQIVSAPESIIKINIEEEKTTSIINVDKWHEKIFSLGEIEGIAIINNNEDVIITSIANLTTRTGGSLVQFWGGNLKVNAINSNININFQNAQEDSNLYIGTNSSFNPNGSNANPFNNTTELSISLCSPHLSHKTINFKSSLEDETLVLTENCSNLVINTNGYIIKALICLYVRNVYIHELKLNGYSSYNNNALYMYMSDVFINILTPINIPQNIENYAHIERSQVTLSSTFLNRNDLKVFIKNSKCHCNETLMSRNTFKSVVKENQNAKFYGMKWCNGVLSESVTLPSDFKQYTKARIIYKFNNLSEFTKEINFNSDNYSIRIDGTHQNDTEVRTFTAYLSTSNGVCTKGKCLGVLFNSSGTTIIRNEEIDLKFDIAFYD